MMDFRIKMRVDKYRRKGSNEVLGMEDCALSGAVGKEVLLRVVCGGILVGQDVVGHHPRTRGR